MSVSGPASSIAPSESLTMWKFALPARPAISWTLVCLFVIATAMAAGQSFAAIHTEVGDAGQTQSTAQETGAAGVSLTDIFGSLLSETDADLYLINIVDPAAFSATTFNATGGFLATQWFWLTLSGAPVYVNDDDPGGLTTLSTLPAGNALGPISAGLYLLGVSMSGYDPVNVVNQLLFASGLPTDVRGPATGLQPAVLGGFFDNTFFADSGPYDIQLTGAVAVPEPTTGALVVLAVALCAFVTSQRRRRTAFAAVPA
jgi:hypothetical protein